MVVTVKGQKTSDYDRGFVGILNWFLCIMYLMCFNLIIP